MAKSSSTYSDGFSTVENDADRPVPNISQNLPERKGADIQFNANYSTTDKREESDDVSEVIDHNDMGVKNGVPRGTFYDESDNFSFTQSKAINSVYVSEYIRLRDAVAEIWRARNEIINLAERYGNERGWDDPAYHYMQADIREYTTCAEILEGIKSRMFGYAIQEKVIDETCLCDEYLGDNPACKLHLDFPECERVDEAEAHAEVVRAEWEADAAQFMTEVDSH